jgi:hypothetical protein
VAVPKEISAVAEQLAAQPTSGYISAAIARVKELGRCNTVMMRLTDLNDKLTRAPQRPDQPSIRASVWHIMCAC